MGIEVRRFTWDYLDSNMYALIAEGQALVIDPIDSDEAFDYLKSFQKVTVLLTHEHFDHICGLNRLRAEHQCTIIAQEKCSERIQSSKTNFSAMAETMMELSGKKRDRRIEPFVCEKADITFDDKKVLNWAGNDIEIFSTPGHSPGSACIKMASRLFTGDSLLERGSKNRFPGGSERLYREETIPVLKELIKETNTIYPGHGDLFFLNQKKSTFDCGLL
jgi:glyoxylase-like metal-dependent hydrolase (beta-lactamase superfamily II)